MRLEPLLPLKFNSIVIPDISWMPLEISSCSILLKPLMHINNVLSFHPHFCHMLFFPLYETVT